MMMYEGSGLEEEADYDEEYTVTSTTTGNTNAPAYYPMIQTSSSSGPQYAQVTTGMYATGTSTSNTHIYQQEFAKQPVIQQVFEDSNVFEQPVNGGSYIPTSGPRIQQVLPGQESPVQTPPPTAPTKKQYLPTTPAVVVSTSTSSDKSSSLTSVVPSPPTKKTPLLVPGMIPTLQMPMTRIPKKKREPAAGEVVSRATIPSDMNMASEEGWKMAYNLLQRYDKPSDVTPLTELLNLYLKTDISTALLVSNDTAKIVRRISKSHTNAEVQQLAAQCVSKWKRVIAQPEADKKMKKKEKSSEEKTKKSEKRRSDENEKSKKGSKDAEPSEKRRKEEDAKKSSDAKKPPVATAPKKSSVFMDALAKASEPPRKKPPPRKRPVDSKAPVISDPLSVLDVMTENNKPKVEETTSHAETKRKSPTPPPLFDDIPVKENRKIKFADELGKEMVSIRYFEIEEGERINVNRLSLEEMKHHEAMMERRFKEGGSLEDLDEEEEKEVPWRLLPIDEDLLSSVVRGCNSEAKVTEERRQASTLRAFFDPTVPFNIVDDPEDWDPHAQLPEPMPIPVWTPQEMALRQKMEQIAPAPVIPVSPTPSPQIEEKKESSLPANLANLLAGLKKQGIMGDTRPNAGSIAGIQLFSTQGGSQTNTTPTYSQSAGAQPQYQQVSQQPYAQFQMSGQYQQPAPPQHQQQQYSGMPAGQQQPQSRAQSVPGPSESWAQPGGRRVCHQFRSGHCRFGNRCRFSHDIDNRDRDRAGGSFRDRARPYLDRRDTPRERFRRDFRDERSDRDQRSRDSAAPHSPPASAQSPSIRSPTILSPSANEPIVRIPAERVE